MTGFEPINWDSAYISESNGGYKVFGNLVIVRTQALLKSNFTKNYNR